MSNINEERIIKRLNAIREEHIDDYGAAYISTTVGYAVDIVRDEFQWEGFDG